MVTTELSLPSGQFNKLNWETREEWLELRRKGVGGSDIGAILGLSSYESPTSIWQSKIARNPDREESEAMRIGKLWEPIIRDEYNLETGFGVCEIPYIIQNVDYPFMLASVDGIGRDKDGKRFVFEAKNTNSFDIIHQLECGEPPVSWVSQVLHYLIVTDADYGVIAYQAGNSHHGVLRVDRDPATEAVIINAAKTFWEYVEAGVAPPYDSSKDAQKLLFDDNLDVLEETIDLSYMGTEVAELFKLKADAKELKNKIEAVKTKIKKAMGHYKWGETANFKCTWSRSTGTGFDSPTFKAENPDMVKKYQKDTTNDKFNIRQMKLKKVEE